MREPYPLNPETAAQAFSTALDLFFQSAAFGVYEGDNQKLLDDLGLAVHYGIADESEAVECVRIANWNTKDLFTIERSEDGEDISDGLPFNIDRRISHNDMMGYQIGVPFEVNQQPVRTHTMRYGVTKAGVIVPYFFAKQADEDILLFPDIQDCEQNTPELLAGLLGITELALLTSLLTETDIVTQALEWLDAEE